MFCALSSNLLAHQVLIRVLIIRVVVSREDLLGLILLLVLLLLLVLVVVLLLHSWLLGKLVPSSWVRFWARLGTGAIASWRGSPAD